MTANITGNSSSIFSDMPQTAAARKEAEVRTSDSAGNSLVYPVDSVEISGEARELYNNSLSTEESVAVDKIKIVDEKKLAEMQERISAVLTRKRQISAQINEKLSGLGISTTMLKDLKFEIDKNGKIVAGGIDDVDLIKKIEDVLNTDKDVVVGLKKYQEEEAALSSKLRDETGLSLPEYTRELAVMAKAGDESEPSERLDSAFKSALFSSDPALIDMVKEIATFDGVNFSYEKHGVADPDAALHTLMNKAIAQIKDQFQKYNKNVADTAPTAELAMMRQLSLANANITINGDGSISIDGYFSADPEAGDASADGEEIVRTILNDLLADDTAAGQESVFRTATRKKLQNHDAEFDNSRAEMPKEIRLEINRGVANSYIFSPDAEFGIKEDIKSEAAQHLSSETNGKFQAEDFEVDESGRISFSENFAGRITAEAAEALKKFNEEILDLTYEKNDKDEQERKTLAASESAKTVAKFRRELAAYHPTLLSGGEES